MWKRRGKEGEGEEEVEVQTAALKEGAVSVDFEKRWPRTSNSCNISWSTQTDQSSNIIAERRTVFV